MKNFFWVVANSLLRIAKRMHLTYNEVNILIWYLLIPLSWCIMLDIIIKLPLFTLLLILSWIIIFIIHRKDFQEWCDWLFRKSVDFLLWFQCIGWYYEKSSVIICCLIPIPIYLLLTVLLLKTL